MSRGAEKTRVPLLMRDRSFYHTFLILAGTLILEQAVVLSVNLADNLMIGSYNETALAAVAAVNQIVFVVQQVIYGVTNGVIVLSSQYWGKQQTAPIRRLVCLGLRLEAALTESAEFYAGGQVCVCCLSRQMMAELGASEDDADDISGFPRGIAGVQIGVMIREPKEGGAKLSLRTGEDYNASAICGELGGGGHKAAAGASVSGDMQEAKRRILLAIAKHGVVLE